MKRMKVSTAAAAGVFTLGMAGALALAPSAGAAPGFLAGHPHAAPAAASPGARVKPGSVWTMNAPGAGCNVQTFSAGGVATTDTGFTGTWTKPTKNTFKFNYPTAPAKYSGTYTSGSYTGRLKYAGTKYPGTTLTPGATPDC
jgi:hypothetical protein